MKLVLRCGLMVGILFIQNPTSASASSFNIGPGPVNITRKVGEDDVVIICPAYGPGAPIWQINGLLYGASSVPHTFESAYETLLIPSVGPDMNNYTFQCFIPASDSLSVMESSVGVLSVDESAEDYKYESPVYSSLEINHQNLRFNDDNMTLSWLYTDGGNIPDCSSVSFRIQGWVCKPTNGKPRTDSLWNLTTSDTNITIPLNILTYNESLVYVTLEAIRKSDNSTVCVPLNFGFQTIQNITTKVITTSVGDNVCINVPPSGPLSAAWPYTPLNQSLGDCNCPLCDGIDCNLEKCHCINDTVYTVTLIPDASYYQLCFNGIKEEMNVTNVHFYSELIHCKERTTTKGFFPQSPAGYRLYIASYRIIIKAAGVHSKEKENPNKPLLPKEPPVSPVPVLNENKESG